MGEPVTEWEKTGEAAQAASPQKGTMTAHEDVRVTTRSTCDHILESSARADGSEGIPSRHASRASKHIPQVNPQCRTRAFLLSRQYRSDLPGQFIPYPRDNVNHFEASTPPGGRRPPRTRARRIQAHRTALASKNVRPGAQTGTRRWWKRGPLPQKPQTPS